MTDDVLTLIYELLNRRDLSPEQEHLIVQKLELEGCCETRIEFERRILMRFRECSGGDCCPETLKKKILLLLKETE